MNILEKIVEHKRAEIAERKRSISVMELEQRAFFSRQPLSLKKFLLDQTRTGIIAEFKRKSPSKGIINERAAVAEVTAAYALHGASGLSVLTDSHFFGGRLMDLEEARFNEVPILRKDFMIDEFQVIEARSAGADVILLIAACLSPARVKSLAATARSLGMEVLLEIHQHSELDHICDDIDLVGVNNRDLRTFTVNVELSVDLGRQIPAEKIKISESGIGSVETIKYLKNAGFRGFLIGENFMKQPEPSIAFASFVHQLKGGAL